MPAKSKNVAKDKAKVSRSTKENNAKGKKTLKSFKKRKTHTHEKVCVRKRWGESKRNAQQQSSHNKNK